MPGPTRVIHGAEIHFRDLRQRIHATVEIQDICWLRRCRGLRSRSESGALTRCPPPDPRKLEEGGDWIRNSKSVAAEDVGRGGKPCYPRCRGLYLHLRPRPMSRTDAPPCLPGASHLYGEEAKELALAPVGLARHRTKWPCDL